MPEDLQLLALVKALFWIRRPFRVSWIPSSPQLKYTWSLKESVSSSTMPRYLNDVVIISITSWNQCKLITITVRGFNMTLGMACYVWSTWNIPVVIGYLREPWLIAVLVFGGGVKNEMSFFPSCGETWSLAVKCDFSQLFVSVKWELSCCYCIFCLS